MLHKVNKHGKLPKFNGWNTAIWCPRWYICTLLIHCVMPHASFLSATSNYGGCHQWSLRCSAHVVSLFTSFQEDLHGSGILTNFVLSMERKKTRIQERHQPVPWNTITLRMEATQWMWTLETVELSNLQGRDGILDCRWITSTDLITWDIRGSFGQPSAGGEMLWKFLLIQYTTQHVLHMITHCAGTLFNRHDCFHLEFCLFC